MILVLGGTIESRQTADRLRESGYRVVLSTATSDGGKFIENGASVRSGPLTEAGLAAFIDKHTVRAIVDATHPFALKITGIARGVCEQRELPYMRLERGPSKIKRNKITAARSILAAIEVLEREGNRIFLASGVKSIGKFVEGANRKGQNPEFFARVLPTVESITEAARWLPPAHIVAAIGPFDYDFNRWCWQRFNIDTVVTKDSGAGAGVEAKVDSALEMGLRVIVIERPVMDPDGFADPHQLVDALARVVGTASDQLVHGVNE